MTLPLSSIRVIDATNSIAGPFTGMILGDLGAEVIKIEPPGRGDISRAWGPGAFGGMSTSFLACNRNKSGMALDLTQEQGRQVLHDLVKTSDVLLTNVLPHKREKLGLDYESCRGENEKLIYCAVSAYGVTGSMKNEAGYDALMQARTGLMSITGNAGSAMPPVRIASSLIDMGTGLWSAIGVLAALFERNGTGRGKRIDASLFETAVAWSPQQIMTYFATGEPPRKYGSGVEMIAPYEAYASSDGFIVIAANTEEFWRRLCGALNLPRLLEDARYTDNRSRVMNRVALSEEVEACTRRNTTAYWKKRLGEAGVPCEPVASIADIVQDEQTKALAMIRNTRAASGGDDPGPSNFLDIAPPFMLDGKRPPMRQLPPGLGEHTRAWLERLGYPEERIEEMVARGVVTMNAVA